ncbi:hypothetical protein GP486_004444 [Trichoglossum hirsutum]|uniref:Protein kinase domain-containing protein n=1 Tax=Trichoglossum hirsutum TaxID=265104 RepID=A0A9P8LBB9_9PEZI|nr:hypothetical protein GP486_004444 [Trichoglossum hirsutum]
MPSPERSRASPAPSEPIESSEASSEESTSESPKAPAVRYISPPDMPRSSEKRTSESPEAPAVTDASPPDMPRSSEKRTNESPKASAVTDISPPDMPHSSEKRMSELFSESNGEGRSVYTDAEFIQISTYLRNTGRQSWSNVPRLYTVLRLIGQLPMLDAIVDQGITDIWFPFTSASLPDDFPPSARAGFLQSQYVVLSKALRFEKNSDRKHAHFAQGEPLPFEVVGRLGSGAHGYVDKVMSTVSHREYARKLFRRKRGFSKDGIKSFLMELQVLKRVSHIHCVELVQSYTDPKYFALIMSPVADCNLFEYYDVASGSSDKLSLLRSFFGCLANALQYIHDIKIRHRDIKPQNVLVKADRVLLTDFGIALDWEHLSRSTTTADSGKTWPYAAPEVARYEKRNTSADVWSLGCIFLEMVTVLKGESATNMRNFFRERTENYRFYANLAHVPEWMDKLRELGSAKDNVPLEWVTHMLRETPDHRPTAARLFNDISAKCSSQHIPFCGPCCREDIESSDLDDDDDDELWGHEGEPTLESLEA